MNKEFFESCVGKECEVDLFKKEITELIKKEEDKKEKGNFDYNPNLIDIDPEQLTEKDCNIYQMFKEGPKGSLTFGMVSEYRKDILKDSAEKEKKAKEELVLLKERLVKNEITLEDARVQAKEIFDRNRSRANFCDWITNGVVSEEWLAKFRDEGEIEKGHEKKAA